MDILKLNRKVEYIKMDYVRMPICDLSNSDLMMQFFMNLSQHTKMPSTNNGTGGMEYPIGASLDDNAEGSNSEAAVPYQNHQWYEIVIPAICLFGVIGNILNLIVLTHRRMQSCMDDLEKSATYGLISLAFSDMMFCITVFPHSFILEHKVTTSTADAYQLYYKLYGVALINLFLMASTWLTVYMAINRYIVVVYPFQARWTLGTKKTILAILLVYIVSTSLTLPFFLHTRIRKCMTLEGSHMYEISSLWSLHNAETITFYIRWIWPILANFFPLVLLAFVNIRLIKELKVASIRRQNTCQGQVIQSSSHRVTLTLVIIVLMLLFLVSPSEILRYINPYENMGNVGHVLSSFTNMFQIFNFAFNFILYCVVSKNFRQTTKSLFACCCSQDKDDSAAIEMNTMLTQVNSTKSKKNTSFSIKSGSNGQTFV